MSESIEQGNPIKELSGSQLDPLLTSLEQSTEEIKPGAWLGVLGGGQLGQMFAEAAQAMGYFVHVYAPEPEPPASLVASKTTQAEYLDEAALTAFATSVSAVSLEFENIPVEALRILQPLVPVRPGPRPLEIAQNRLKEKTWLHENGFPVTPFHQVEGVEGIQAAIENLGLPGVLKTAGFGYDGKGQRVIRSPEDIEPAWASLETDTAIFEQWIEFEAEASILTARSPRGDIQCYPLVRNEHRNHILHETRIPGGFSTEQQAQAETIARELLTRMHYEGLLCIEFFVLRDGQLLINEIAPRPHNSGHVTIEACEPSQFEMQVEAICNRPLRAPTLRKPGCMINLLGDIWEQGEPPWKLLDDETEAFLHLYGKKEARAGRKMGHLTVLDSDTATASERAQQLFASLHT